MNKGFSKPFSERILSGELKIEASDVNAIGN